MGPTSELPQSPTSPPLAPPPTHILCSDRPHRKPKRTAPYGPTPPPGAPAVPQARDEGATMAAMWITHFQVGVNQTDLTVGGRALWELRKGRLVYLCYLQPCLPFDTFSTAGFTTGTHGSSESNTADSKYQLRGISHSCGSHMHHPTSLPAMFFFLNVIQVLAKAPSEPTWSRREAGRGDR